MVALLTAGAMVLDFGLVRMDRQENKLAADDAVMAGLRAADHGNDQVFNVDGVCGALAFLKANELRLSGLPSSLATGGSCTGVTSTQVCKPNDSSTAVTYHGTTVSGNSTFEVWIKLPYDVNDATTGGPAFPEEAMHSLTQGDADQDGCDQLGLVIKESTKPGSSPGSSPTSHL